MDAPPTTSDHQSLLDSQLERLGLDRSTPPGRDQWQPLLGLLEEACSVLSNDASEELESMLRRQVARRRSSQSTLFEQSPTPILQMDLAAVEASGGRPVHGSVSEHLPQIEITAANEAAQSLLGIPPASAGDEIDIRRLGVADSAWATLIDMVVSRATTSESEFVGVRPDGQAFEALLLAAVPEPFGVPDYSRVVMSMTDITAHKAEERRMHEIVTSKNRLLAAVTSELRSPLAEVIDFARLLEGPVENAQRRRDLAIAIAGGATRVAGIVEDLLVVSRSELGDLVVAEVPVDLSAQVAQVLEVGGPSMADVSTPGRNVERRVCIGDPARVRQIIRNLVVDALDHLGTDTSITIHRRASTVYLTVSSAGLELPGELNRRVFGPTQEVLGAPVDPDARFMGLSVARQLAITMGGELTYRYECGVGIFDVTLRAASAS